MSSPELSSLSGLLRQSVGEDEALTLDELLERTGTDSFGPTIVILSILSMVPYASFVTGAGLMVVGGQMMVGSRKSWLPKGLLRWRMQGRHVRSGLARLESWLRVLGPKGARRRVLSKPLVGALVLWTAFMLALPLPLVPFANILPAAGLALIGLAVMEQRPLLAGSARSSRRGDGLLPGRGQDRVSAVVSRLFWRSRGNIVRKFGFSAVNRGLSGVSCLYVVPPLPIHHQPPARGGW